MSSNQFLFRNGNPLGLIICGKINLLDIGQDIEIQRIESDKKPNVHFLKNIKQQMSDCVILGDRGYLSQSTQLDWFQTVNIKLDPILKGE